MILTVIILSILTGMDPPDESPWRLDLAGWVSMALQNSPVIHLSEASLFSERASLTGDRAFLYPSLFVTAGASRGWSSTTPPGGDPVESERNTYNAGVSLTQQILQSGGQNWLYSDASELSVMAAEEDHRKVILDVTLVVVNSYYGVLEAIELKKSALDSHDRSVSQLRRTEALYEMGAVRTLELLQVQVQENNDRLSLNRAEQSLHSAYNDLYTAAGADISESLPGINTDAVVDPLPAGAVERITTDISQNPSLIASRLRSRAAGTRTEAAERAYWPSLGASAGWNWSDDTLDDVDRMFDNDNYSIGLSLSWNVFDGFLRESRINSARASALSSRASEKKLENDLGAAVQTLRSSLEIDIQYYHDSIQALELAQEKYRLSVMSYEMGALPLLDLLDAQTGLSSAESNLVSARCAALRTEASLMAALGMPPRLGE